MISSVIRRRDLLALCAAVLLIGCANPGARPIASPAPTTADGFTPGDVDQPNIPDTFWDDPLANGVEVQDVADADLMFVPDEPSHLGPPEKIVATKATDVNPALRAIAWVYRNPQYGRFVIIERITNRPGAEAEIREMAAETPGCHSTPGPSGLGDAEECVYGERSLVTLENGATALVLRDVNTTNVRWILPLQLRSPEDEAVVEQLDEYQDAALKIFVIAPGGSTFDDAVEVANGV